jgi:transcriptional regulator
VYIPELFNIAETSELVVLMRARPFAILISAGSGGLDATHLPTVVKMDAERPASIECHVARANPHWKEFSSGGDADNFRRSAGLYPARLVSVEECRW